MNNIDDLLKRLQNEDKQYSNKVKGLKYMYIAFSLMYIIMIIWHITHGGELYEIISACLLLLGMIGFYYIMNRYQRIYQSQDYTLPTLDMLKEGIKRYKPFAYFSPITIFSIVVIFVGMAIHLDSLSAVLTMFFALIGLLIVTIAIGLVHAKNKYGPLLRDIQEMIDQLESDK